MTTTETIFQCEKCGRFFEEKDGALVMVSIPKNLSELYRGDLIKFLVCGWPDCAAIELKNRTPKPRRFATREHKEHKGCARTPTINHQPSTIRSSCPQDDERSYRFEDATQIHGSTESRPTTVVRNEPPQGSVVVPGLLNPGARQENFIASGATSQTDARVRDFLLAEQNFDKWFSRKFLKDVAKNDLLNNIADRLRDELIPKGFYVDNCMMSDSELGVKSSHYRICRIESAISLSAEEKLKLLAGSRR